MSEPAYVNEGLSVDMTGPQSDFLILPAKNRLFVGGYGSGKTHTMVAAGFRDLMDPRYPGGDVGMYAPTYDLLKLNIEPRIEEWLDQAGFSYSWNKSDHIFDVQGYGRFICRSLDNPSRIIAYEVFRSHVDEIDTLPHKKALEVWQKLKARNRQKIQKVSRGGPRQYAENQVSAYSTPEGFQFTYNTWGKDPAEGYAYVRAPSYSNPHLPEDYVSDLEKDYPAQLVQSYIEGIWTNLTSGTVYSSFDRRYNGTREVEQRGETLHIGMDFNVGKMAAIVHVVREGLPIAVREFVGIYDTPAMVEAIKQEYHFDRFTGETLRPRIIIYPDASGKSRDTRGTPTGGDLRILKDAGFRVNAPTRNPPIKDRVLSMNAMFRNGQGYPRYWVNLDRCPEYALCLEQQAWDPKSGLPDKTQDLDHPNDAGGYFIHNRYPITRQEFNKIPVVGA